MNERHFDEKSVIGIEVISKIKREIKIVLKNLRFQMSLQVMGILLRSIMTKG